MSNIYAFPARPEADPDVRPFTYRLAITRDAMGDVTLAEEFSRDPADCPLLWEYLRDLSARCRPAAPESPVTDSQTAR